MALDSGTSRVGATVPGLCGGPRPLRPSPFAILGMLTFVILVFVACSESRVPRTRDGSPAGGGERDSRVIVASGSVPAQSPGLPAIWTVSTFTSNGVLCLELERSTGGRGTTCMQPSGTESNKLIAQVDFDDSATILFGAVVKSAVRVLVEFRHRPATEVSLLKVGSFSDRFFVLDLGSAPNEIPTLAAVNSRGQLIARVKPGTSGPPKLVPSA